MRSGFPIFITSIPARLVFPLACGHEKKGSAPFAATNLSFNEAKLRVFAPNCVRCHNAGSKIPLVAYADVKSKLSAIKTKALVERSMPPGGALSADAIEFLFGPDRRRRAGRHERRAAQAGGQARAHLRVNSREYLRDALPQLPQPQREDETLAVGHEGSPARPQERVDRAWKTGREPGVLWPYRLPTKKIGCPPPSPWLGLWTDASWTLEAWIRAGAKD